jgi:hypothetical protein
VCPVFARYGEQPMDQEFQADLDGIRHSVEHAEVIALYFPTFRRTLLLDTRHSPVDPPLIRVMPMVANARERVESVRRLRPRLGAIESLALIPWLRSVAALKALGVWTCMVDRLVQAGGPPCEVALERCYRQLVREERAEHHRAVTGEGYETIWQRSPAAED